MPVQLRTQVLRLISSCGPHVQQAVIEPTQRRIDEAVPAPPVLPGVASGHPARSPGSASSIPSRRVQSRHASEDPVLAAPDHSCRRYAQDPRAAPWTDHVPSVDHRDQDPVERQLRRAEKVVPLPKRSRLGRSASLIPIRPRNEGQDTPGVRKLSSWEPFM